MGLPKKLAAPLALSFAVMAGSAFADEQDNIQHFTCDAQDLSSYSLQNKLDVLMPANVFINAATPRELSQQQLDALPEGAEPPLSRGLGSGFIVDPSGYILTNNHVVEGATEVTVTFYDPDTINNVGETVDATVVGLDSDLDLAVLKVEMENPLPCVVLGDSDLVRRGDDAFAIGNPQGLAFTLTKGYVSHPLRNIGNRFYDYLQTDAAINPGNSGGGLYNDAGEIIGINSSIYRNSTGLGFVIKANDILEVAEDILEFGRGVRAGLGVQVQDVTDETATNMGVEEGVGVLITKVVPNRPAAIGGMLENDIVLEINGEEVNSSAGLVREISKYDPGNDVSITLLRNGVEMVLQMSLTDRENAIAPLAQPPAEAEEAPQAPTPAP